VDKGADVNVRTLLLGCCLASCASVTTPVVHICRPPKPQRVVEYTPTGDDLLPAEFAKLSPCERERWHACRAFFMRRRTAGQCEEGSRAEGPDAPCFSMSVSDYLHARDIDRRATLLAEHGCPKSIVELADGTHLDVVEGTTQ
jgi:hypothetical protein